MARTTANKVADFFIHFCHEHGDFISNLKLQKLVYYAQAWHLALYDEPLFNEPIEAWVHGPVIPELYRKFKHYGWEPISYEPDEIELDEHTKQHLIEIIDVFGGFTAYELEQMTHNEAPWVNARQGLAIDEPSNAIISHEDMRNYYKRIASQEDDSDK